MFVDPSTNAAQDVYLWALGVLATIVGALMLIILNRVMKQGDDTNQKVTEQGSMLGRMEQSVGALDGQVKDLAAWRNEQVRKESAAFSEEVLRLRALLEDRRGNAS